METDLDTQRVRLLVVPQPSSRQGREEALKKR